MEGKKNTAQCFLMDLSKTYFSKLFVQASHYGLHPGQIPILGILNKHDGISQRELAKMLGVKPSTVTISIHRLGKNDLVECRPDGKDRRKSCLYLTEAGKRFSRKMNEILEMNETFILKGFSESETKCLNDFVKRIIHNIGEIPEIIPEDDETKR
ncbi:MAG: MarR family winged helix-turn-helix transcriptional regulator [Lachnospiraceae bacterium]|nr:winged helix-turn-helix transcriptional regulator [Candidatus Fimimorpha excrementavium]